MGSPKKKTQEVKLVAQVNNLPLSALQRLVTWFQRQRRILPWREEPTLYRVWISEIMLQQTQVITVLPYFDRFMATFPTVRLLAAASDESVMKAWAGLGYYSRARNLHRAAKMIVLRAGKEKSPDAGFPLTKEAWLEIPGVGPYTAGAITSIALGLPEPIVDGNVERVFSRLRLFRRSEGDVPYKEKLWALSTDSVQRAHAKGLSASELNQAWMELGATICTPRKPVCLLCPIGADCDAKAAGVQEQFPEKKKRAEWVPITEARVALVDDQGARVYLEQAAPGEWRAGLWDFPAKKPPRVKGLAEEPIVTKHVVTKHKITRHLEIFRVSAKDVTQAKLPGRWISMEDPEVGLGSATKKGIQAIRERFF